jgi:two-component system, OmpR family, KDP operon response regulator KdpE
VSERILIVEDDNELAEFTSWQLTRAGYQTQTTHRGAEGLDRVREWQPDLVILDIMMPDMDGWTACQQIREISDIPIIFTTALGMEKDIVRGLEMGADDYLVKPFGPKELIARIRTVLRRHRDTSNRHEQIYTNGDLYVNLDTREVRVNGQVVELTPIEFKLLNCFVEQEGKVLPHGFLLNQAWGPEHEDERQYLKLYIWYLRQKIEADPTHPKLILTQRGVGYRLARTTKTAKTPSL